MPMSLPAGDEADETRRQVGAHQVEADRGDEEGQRHRREPEERALGEEPAHQPPAPGAERQAQRDLALPLGAAGEQEVGDVGAGDEEDEARRGLPEREDRTQPLVHHPLRQGVDAGAAVAVRPRGTRGRAGRRRRVICACASSRVRPGASRATTVR